METVYQSLVSFEYWTFIAQLLNLFIQIYLFKRFLFKPVKAIIAKRQAQANSVLEDAEKEKIAAQQAKDEYNENLKKAYAEAEKISANTLESAKMRSEQIINEAQEKAYSIREKATREIELERRKAMNEAKNEISSLAVDIATTLVKKEIDEKDHEVLIQQFIDEIGD